MVRLVQSLPSQPSVFTRSPSTSRSPTSSLTGDPFELSLSMSHPFTFTRHYFPFQLTHIDTAPSPSNLHQPPPLAPLRATKLCRQNMFLTAQTRELLRFCPPRDQASSSLRWSYFGCLEDGDSRANILMTGRCCPWTLNVWLLLGGGRDSTPWYIR